MEKLIKFLANKGDLILEIDFILVLLGILWLVNEEEKKEKEKK